MNKLYYVDKEDDRESFWNIEWEEGGTSYTEEYGLLGEVGERVTTQCDTPEICKRLVDEEITAHRRKRYTEMVDPKYASDPLKDAQRFSVSYEESEEGEGEKPLCERMLAYEKRDQLCRMTIATWARIFDGDSIQELLDWLVEHAADFPALEVLNMGDATSEECELSWIIQGDYSKLWAAFPRLKELRIQGSNELRLGKIESESLESLTVFCGGLPKSVLEEVGNANTPNLKKLNLYFGEENYGMDATGIDVRSMLENSNFPKLEYLGLCNSDFPQEIFEAIAHSKYAAQITTLDLSMSTVDDTCAERILAEMQRFPRLEMLDLHYHYLSEEMEERLLKESPDTWIIDLGDPQGPQERYKYPMYTE
ncbi:MAG: WGR domain-containing protein [Anaerotruncus sp.]|nr:WGR domain-containing protein [Anaerotruncus sp.]